MPRHSVGGAKQPTSRASLQLQLYAGDIVRNLRLKRRQEVVVVGEVDKL